MLHGHGVPEMCGARKIQRTRIYHVHFLQACTAYRANFEIYEVEQYDPEILKSEWLRTTAADIEMQIAAAKDRKKEDRTARQQTIVRCYVHICASIRQERKQHSTMQVIVTDEGMLKSRILDIDVLKQGLQKLQAVAVDAQSGKLLKISVWDWLFAGYYAKYALVLYGHSGRGKSVAGLSLCAAISRACQSPADVEESYIIKAGTVDSLRSCCSAGLMKAGTALLMDDVTPAKQRGTRPSMAVEEVKHMVMVDDVAQAADGRTADIQFADQQARVFTSNAMTIKAWCDALCNVEALTDTQRFEMDQDAMAVHRRTFFAYVGANDFIVPAVARKRFHRDTLAEAAAKVARCR